MNLLTFNKICHLICLQLCYNYSIKYNFAVLICYNPPVFLLFTSIHCPLSKVIPLIGIIIATILHD